MMITLNATAITKKEMSITIYVIDIFLLVTGITKQATGPRAHYPFPLIVNRLLQYLL